MTLIIKSTLNISRSNILWYWTQYERKKAKTLFKPWTHRRHFIPCPLFTLLGEEMQRDIEYIFCHHYFSGIWGIGVATKLCNLNTIPLGSDENSWVLRHDGIISHNNEEKAKLEEMPQEGDILVSSDSRANFKWTVMLKFYFAAKFGNLIVLTTEDTPAQILCCIADKWYWYKVC